MDSDANRTSLSAMKGDPGYGQRTVRAYGDTRRHELDSFLFGEEAHNRRISQYRDHDLIEQP
ncbi:MAG TPA: hypothetical protein VM143_14920 [Acidimicrobiales bacterium]|nr:hypothetical protein [Acidimicrobiales bacterium]